MTAAEKRGATVASRTALLGQRYSAAARVPALTPLQASMREQILRRDVDSDWESAPCLCGGGADVVVSEVERHGLPYRKCLCLECGLLRVDPRWTTTRLSRFYEEEYRSLYAGRGERSVSEYASWVATQPSARSVARFVESAVASHLTPSTRSRKVVEIGAGGGWNMAALPPGWQRIGYDGDASYLQAGRELFGVDMRNGFLDQADADIADADVVLLSHVVEHFSDPVGALSRVATRLSPDSLLLIEVPGVFKIHRSVRDPMVYMQNAHLFTFCASTLANTCRAAGLEVLQVDETCRLVAKRASSAPVGGFIAADPLVAGRVLSYLHRCERGNTLAAALRRLPVVGTALSRAAAKFWNEWVGSLPSSRST